MDIVSSFCLSLHLIKNIRLIMSISALERLSNEETHCRTANSAILKFSLTKPRGLFYFQYFFFIKGVVGIFLQ